MRCTDALGFQAAAALGRYEELLAAVCAGDPDPERTGALQVQLRRVCTCCLGIPQLSGTALALLLAHHRLLAVLARSGAGLADADAEQSSRQVRECVQILNRGCRELFVAPHLQ